MITKYFFFVKDRLKLDILSVKLFLFESKEVIGDESRNLRPLLSRSGIHQFTDHQNPAGFIPAAGSRYSRTKLIIQKKRNNLMGEKKTRLFATQTRKTKRVAMQIPANLGCAPGGVAAPRRDPHTKSFILLCASSPNHTVASGNEWDNEVPLHVTDSRKVPG